MKKILMAAIQIVVALMTIPSTWGQANERKIVINITEKRLHLFEESKLVKIYDVAVGKPATPTPVGEFTITLRIKNPSYYVRHVGEIPAGKNNPLGSRWIGLSKKSYGIHGTNVASSIGKPASSGCIRMRNRDVEDLFSRVEAGDTVEIVTEELARTDKPEGTSFVSKELDPAPLQKTVSGVSQGGAP